MRTLLLDPDLPPVSERAEALLMAADRAQHVDEVVRPALEEGRWVVTERFSGSTLAYQGYGRGLDLDELRRLVLWATGGIDPDLTILLDVPLSSARGRRISTRADRLGAPRRRLPRVGCATGTGPWPRPIPTPGSSSTPAATVEVVAEQLLAVVVERLGPLPTTR